MKKNLLHVLWILAAVLLITAGIGCMANAGAIMDTLANWIGLLMVCSGLLQIVVNFFLKDTIFGDRTFLVKAVVAIVVGIFIMCKSFIAGEVLAVLISMMVLVDGISVLGAAMAMNHDRVPGRVWLWVIGIIEALLGIAGFLKPEILNIATAVVIGISLIYEGLVLLYTWFIGMKWRTMMNL